MNNQKKNPQIDRGETINKILANQLGKGESYTEEELLLLSDEALLEIAKKYNAISYVNKNYPDKPEHY